MRAFGEKLARVNFLPSERLGPFTPLGFAEKGLTICQRVVGSFAPTYGP